MKAEYVNKLENLIQYHNEKIPVSKEEKESDKTLDILEALTNKEIITFNDKPLTEEQRQMVIKLTRALLGD